MAETEGNEDRKHKKGGKAEYITPPHTIRTKVSGGGPLSSQMLKKAEEVVQKHAENISNARKIKSMRLSRSCARPKRHRAIKQKFLKRYFCRHTISVVLARHSAIRS